MIYIHPIIKNRSAKQGKYEPLGIAAPAHVFHVMIFKYLQLFLCSRANERTFHLALEIPLLNLLIVYTNSWCALNFPFLYFLDERTVVTFFSKELYAS